MEERLAEHLSFSLGIIIFGGIVLEVYLRLKGFGHKEVGIGLLLMLIIGNLVYFIIKELARRRGKENK